MFIRERIRSVGVKCCKRDRELSRIPFRKVSNLMSKNKRKRLQIKIFIK